MPTTHVDLSRELGFARELAIAAGALLLRHRGKVAVEHKTGDEPVTIADRESSTLIVSGLKRVFPNDVIISEEEPDDALRRQGAARLWLIDPLDGTKDFVRGDDGFAVMIGLVIDGRPLLGVVNQVLGQRLYFAAAGQPSGVVMATGVRPLQLSLIDQLSAVRLVASKSHRDGLLNRVKQAIGAADELHVGSVGVKMGMIAVAERDLYINTSDKTKLWDTCAPEAILCAAGGKVTDLHGAPLRYDQASVWNEHGIVASNGLTHDAALARIAPLIVSGLAAT